MDPPASIVDALGNALREARYAGALSQRRMAEQLGISKSMLGRLETGDGSRALAVAEIVLRQLGFALVVVDERPHEERHPVWDVGGVEEDVVEIVDCWRERVRDEVVRDAAGRRPPAHRHQFPIRIPHRWWAARHPQTAWVDRPVWSWSRYSSWPAAVRRLGRHPPPVGLPPRGGQPMQGFPAH